MTAMQASPTDAEPRPVILDVDTGIDDMIALLIAATAPELNLRGVTCVAGNVEIHHVARNTGKILRMVGRGDVPVSIGAARPLHRRLRTAPDTHGPTGTGYVELTGEDPDLGATDYTAVPAPRYLAAHIQRRPGQLTVVALGPLTNIASAALNGVDLAGGLRRLQEQADSGADPRALSQDLGRLLGWLLEGQLPRYESSAQWPGVLAFLVEAALALEDTDAARRLTRAAVGSDLRATK